MSRSPLAYPLNRAADTDVGGAADLQTDVMRFMAILALCLVAIFALVQSIPLTPAEPLPVPAEPAPVPHETAPAAEPDPDPPATPMPRVDPAPQQDEQAIVLKRPEWVPRSPVETADGDVPAPPEPVASEDPAPEEPPQVPEQDGFTLRFASDAALTRAVAAHRVGLYALEPGGAKRMTVSESRISFWDASMPNAFHEMEAATVPDAVVRALARAGIEPGAVNWGVTLPGKMSTQLEALMQQHRGGSLIIAANGDIHWEATQ